MKKLIAMIGAVATAFGLFAADPFAISFEQAEDSQNMGVDTSLMTFTTEGISGWTWGGEALTLKGYETGEAFAYGTGKLERRDSMFKDRGLGDNANYLSLKTGTEELTRAVGEGNMYLDQLVKFTGFEDPQTNLTADAKIAVWMSEFWNDDETVAETNLYVTVGKVDSLGAVEQVALKIHGTYELDTWYRISIKSLGDIYKGAEFTTKRAGFLVYVNGVQVYSDDIVARELAPVASMDGIAKSYMDNGLLFTSIAADDTFTSVSYKGIGAIDDVIIDAAGPEFCQAIPVTIVLPEDDEGNALITIDKVMVGGTVLPQPWEVPDNTEISVFFSPVNGKKITTGASPVVATITSSDSTVDLSDGSIVVEDVVAKLNGTTDLAESELAGALAELQEDEFIETVAACSIVEGEEEEETTLYSFTPNTKITATADGLSIYVGNYVEETTTAGMLECYAGVASGVTLVVELEDTDQGMFLFAGDVVGTLVADAVEVTDAITVSGTLTAEALTIDETITLSGAGKVVTKSAVEDDAIVGEDEAEIEPVQDTPDTGWTTYQIKQAPDTVEITFVDGENSTITPLAGVSNLVVGTEIKLIATPAVDYEFAAEEYEGWTKQEDGTLTQEVTIGEEEETFTAPDATAIMVDFTVAEVTGATLLAVSNGTEEVFADQGKYTVPTNATVTLYYAPAEGYRLGETTAEVTIDKADQVVDVSDEIAPAQIAYVAEVNGTQYETFEEAVAALTADGQTIKLLKATKLTTKVTPAFSTTFDMGGFELDAKLEKAITCSNGKTLNVTNGTIAISHKSYTIEVYGTLNVQDGARIVKDNDSGPVIDVYDTATVNVEAGAYLNNGGSGQTFRFKDEHDTSNCTYTVNVKGGNIDGTGANLFDVYKPGATATITISGGTINATTLLRVGADDQGKKDSATVALAISGGTINATTKNLSICNDSVLNLTLDGNCKAKFKVDQGLNDYCAEGYKAKDNGEGWYTIQAIQYATLAVTADEGITYVLTNKTTDAVVSNGYRADIDNAEVIEAVELAFEAGYELNTEASTTSVTLNTATPAAIVLKKQLKTFAVTFYGDSEKTNTLATQQVEYNGYVTPVAAPTREGFEFQGWNANTNVAITAATDFWATWKAVTPEPTRPTPIDGGDEDQKKAYDDWAKTAGDVSGMTEAAIVNRFVMNVPAATTDAELIAKADEELESIADAALKAIMAGETPDLSALQEKYPNATIKLVQSDKLTSTETAKFFQLKFSFTPANQQDE